MATESSHTLGGPARPWLRAELTLALLAVVSLALIPIRITTIYSGLPAHPLFLHVPVVLIPVAVLWALVLVVHPAWFARSGAALATVTVAALAGTVLTTGAGSALRDALHLNGGFGPSALVARHAHAADILRLLMIAFTAVVILTLLAHRVAAGRPTGHRAIDRDLARPRLLIGLRTVLVALAIACGYFVFHTGDLGAKAVWAGRLSGSGGGGGPGFGGFGGGPGRLPGGSGGGP